MSETRIDKLGFEIECMWATNSANTVRVNHFVDILSAKFSNYLGEEELVKGCPLTGSFNFSAAESEVIVKGDKSVVAIAVLVSVGNSHVIIRIHLGLVLKADYTEVCIRSVRGPVTKNIIQGNDGVLDLCKKLFAHIQVSLPMYTKDKKVYDIAIMEEL